MEKEKITISIPHELLPLLAKKRKDVLARVFEFMVLELYRLGEISSGKAAQMLDMERFEFVKFASRLGIPFIDMDEEELVEDYKQAHKSAKKIKQ